MTVRIRYSQWVAGVALAIGALVLDACGPQQEIANAQAAIAGVEALLPALDSAAGVSDATTQTILQYGSDVSACLQQAGTIIGNAPSVSGVMAAQIAAGCSSVVKPNLPAGSPQKITAAVGAIAAALAAFLQGLPQVPVSRAMSAVQSMPVSNADRSAMLKVKSRADAALVKITARKR